MVKRINEQIRESIKETEYEIKFRDKHFVLTATGVQKMADGPDIVLLNKITGVSELWTKNDSFAGYVLEIDGVGFEFVRSLN